MLLKINLMIVTFENQINKVYNFQIYLEFSKSLLKTIRNFTIKILQTVLSNELYSKQALQRIFNFVPTTNKNKNLKKIL